MNIDEVTRAQFNDTQFHRDILANLICRCTGNQFTHEDVELINISERVEDGQFIQDFKLVSAYDTDNWLHVQVTISQQSFYLEIVETHGG